MTAPSDDARVAAAIAVLGGRDADTVAAELDVQVDLVHRWVAIFRRAGEAAVRNRPDREEAWARDRILAAISHELRTPLAKVRAALDLLGLPTDPEDLPPSALHKHVKGSFEQLDELLQRLMETTRASYGRTELVRSEVLLSELLADTGATIAVDGLVDVDPERLQLVLDDLLALADRGPGTTDVRLRAGRDGDWAEIVVERDGDPWDPGRLQAELDPFSPRTLHTDITFGVHLAIALTVQHGGHLGVRRRGGTDELWVRLPAQPAPDAGLDRRQRPD